MATGWQPSRLLALPQELRTRIYEELLCPEPAKVHTLWHDREGRQSLLNLYPSILRVNKQIYFEARSLLYDNNTLEIDLATNVVPDLENKYSDGKPDPRPLFQKDAIGADPWSDERPAADAYFSIEKAKGVIDAHSLQRLRHIKLRTKRAAIWGRSARIGRGGIYFSHTEQLIMRILQLLSEQQCVAIPVEQTLDFEVVPDWLTRDGVFGAGRSDANDDANVIEMLRLLREIKKKRSVLVEENIKPGDGGGFQPLEKMEVDVDARLAQFQELAPGHFLEPQSWTVTTLGFLSLA